ncbi:bifunctional 2-polyprenyl-6-hydroxyphenol methylase/3-demethylubiquinol 3-O-methyltransferase UbiG [Kibdelosporangium persicum]|uniref:Class I SAM-dependent methyltransferase n=1 Tax=Kibdelosporangium persicum TaxID=2698649 RepID=A0ABX2EW14_9PSEU|nr:class I SAM-dependent methyltransferase [Kibdelosporangium persicum]NRN63218.1 Class I SAM-dependent methyltransferase [Kibdelosporangium persicum]
MATRTAPGIYHRAELYDVIYRGRGKDYQGDVRELVELVRARNERASSLLDVACGTGGHLRHFAKEFERVAGVDLAQDMVDTARRNLPGIPVHQGDMCRFDLGERFDVITCMFSSIGYLGDVSELDSALRCLAAHLNPGGVLIIEPWWFPERAVGGHVVSNLVSEGDYTVSRVSHAVLTDKAHEMQVHYIVATPEQGIEHFTDTHVLSLFTREQYESAFTKAGCAVEYLTEGRPGPGLFIGTKAS